MNCTHTDASHISHIPFQTLLNIYPQGDLFNSLSECENDEFHFRINTRDMVHIQNILQKKNTDQLLQLSIDQLCQLMNTCDFLLMDDVLNSVCDALCVKFTREYTNTG